MKPLSQLLNESTIEGIKMETAKKTFPGISFETAMKFILSDGILPSSEAPVRIFLDLEDWLRAQNSIPTYSATDLKNKTGEIIEQVLRGRTIRLSKHGRAFAQIMPIDQ